MFLFAMLACAPSEKVEPVPLVAPVEKAAVIVFVRHAEKAKDGTPDPPLTEAGTTRAACLAETLGPILPTRILTTEYQRTRATLAPTAVAFGIEPTVIPAGEDEKWLEALRSSKPGTVTLVSAHSNTIPQLVGDLGGVMRDLDEKGNIPESEYNRMVYVTLDPMGRATSSVVTHYCMPAVEEG